MKTTLLSFLLFLSYSLTAQFIGDYDVSNWTVEQVNNSNGNVNTADAPASITITGSDGYFAPNAQTNFIITVPQPGIITFDWSYYNTDIFFGPFFDPAGYMLNGAFITLANGIVSGSGQVSLPVIAGDVFGFSQRSNDGIFGPAFLTISNFNFCGDSDGDGFFDAVCGGDDCNDNDPTINPNATEICDGQDNDCDGMVDEGFDIYSGNILFTSQAQLDAWSPCVTTINGSVIIQGAGIFDLSPLMAVQTITGNLTIQYGGMFNLNGLQGLQSVGGTVTIFYNFILSSLVGLENLNSVGGSFWMYYNFLLSDCCAIDNLLSSGGVSGTVSIFFNASGSQCNSAANIMASCPILPLIGQSPDATIIETETLVTEGAKELSLYPNPAKSTVNIRFDRNAPTATLRIMDVLGRVILEKQLEEGVEFLNLELENGQFQNGIYLVSLLENGSLQTRQLMVQQ